MCALNAHQNQIHLGYYVYLEYGYEHGYIHFQMRYIVIVSGPLQYFAAHKIRREWSNICVILAAGIIRGGT